MPLMHCNDCHHEWDSTSDKSLCDWCGESGYILDPQSLLDKFCEKLKSAEYRRSLVKANGLPWYHESSFIDMPADRVWER